MVKAKMTNTSAAEPMSADMALYDSVFRTVEFWNANVTDEEIKKILNERVFMPQDPEGDYWDSILSARKDAIDIVRQGGTVQDLHAWAMSHVNQNDDKTDVTTTSSSSSSSDDKGGE